MNVVTLWVYKSINTLLMSQFKEHKARLQQKTRPRLLLGLTAALALALVGFEWKTYDETEIRDEMVVLDGITMEIPPVQASRRKPITIPKTIVDAVKVVTDDTPDPTDEPKSKVDYRPDIDYTTVEIGPEGDEPDEDTIDLSVPFSLNNLSNTPHLADCADLEDRNQRDQCTFSQMRKLVASKANYPAMAKDRGIQGVVRVGFLIDKDGSVSDVEIVESVHKLLDDEAMRSIKLLPTFIPGKVGKHPVKVYYEMPVSFKIR